MYRCGQSLQHVRFVRYLFRSFCETEIHVCLYICDPALLQCRDLPKLLCHKYLLPAQIVLSSAGGRQNLLTEHVVLLPILL